MTTTTDRGSVIPLVAIFMGVLLIAGFMAIDVGRMTDTNRSLQSVADLASIDAVRSIDGRTAAEQQADIELAAEQSANRNQHGGGSDELAVELGTVDALGDFTVSAPGEVPNAVRVFARRPVAMSFIDTTQNMERSAVASRGNWAGLTLGSFAAAVDVSTVPLLNDTLGTQLGGPLSLTLIGYQGLADARITLGELAAAAGVGTVDQLLALDLTAAQFLDVTVAALTSRGDTQALAALGAVDALRLAATTATTFRLADLVDVEVGNTASVADVDLAVGDLVRGAATAVSQGQVLDLGLDLSVAGLVDASVKVALIEAPQTVIGGPGAQVSTSQGRIYLDLTLLDVLGAPVRLPLAIDVAPASATLLDIACGSSASPAGVTSEVDPSLAMVRVGELTDAQLLDGSAPSRATILSVPLIIDVEADSTTVIDSAPEVITHVPVYDHNNTIRVGASGLDSSLVIQDLNLYATVLGILGIGLDVDALLLPGIEAVLSGLIPVVNQLVQVLGLTVGGADTTVFASGCQQIRLLD